MHAVIGRVRIKPGHEEQTRSMIVKRGVAMVNGMAGSGGGDWAGTLDGELVHHSFWLDTEQNAQRGGHGHRPMGDARRPAAFVSAVSRPRQQSTRLCAR